MAFTYFFRDLQTLEVIVDHILPTIRSRLHIDIWSAGCAMGQEPYTIALLLKEHMGPMIFRNVRIFATDIDHSNLFENIITRGSYPKKELQRMPNGYLTRYFSLDPEKPGNYIIAPEIRKALQFQKHDLLSQKPIRQGLSLISCKNVLLHFTEEERTNVIRMFHSALADGGFFLTEQTQKMPHELCGLFEKVVPHAQVYKKI